MKTSTPTQPDTPGRQIDVPSGGIVVEDVRQPRAKAFSRRKARERNRQLLSVASLLLLSMVVVSILAAVILGLRTWTELSGVTAAILPAVLSLCTASMAYFFSDKRRGK